MISRVVNGEFRIGNDEREQYLRRVPQALTLSDWLPLAFALMSNHVHWAKLAAVAALARFFLSLHSGFANAVNGAHQRNGPFFMGRPGDWIVEPSYIARTVAYIHNNPVRAKVVRSPEESHWTSHRAYVGLDPAPPWLDVEVGLRLCGFDSSPKGRAAFHEFVCSEVGVQRDERLTWSEASNAQSTARAKLNAPVQLGSATIADESLHYPVLAPANGLIRPRWPRATHEVVESVATELGLDVDDILSHSRRRDIVHGRRLAVQVGRAELGLPLTEVAAALGITPGGASNLLTRYKGDRASLAAIAARLGSSLWQRAAGE